MDVHVCNTKSMVSLCSLIKPVYRSMCHSYATSVVLPQTDKIHPHKSNSTSWEQTAPSFKTCILFCRRFIPHSYRGNVLAALATQASYQLHKPCDQELGVFVTARVCERVQRTAGRIPAVVVTSVSSRRVARSQQQNHVREGH